MEDISFNSYQRLEDVDPNITSISYLEDVLVLGNSYGDIKIVNGKGSQILHNHSGEITALIAKRCCKTEEEDVVYLLSGTSIGNVYVHLVFLNKIWNSRILYKFETGYSVYSICLHPKYRIYNFKRVNRRLTVDFKEEVAKDYDNWSNLQNSSISQESFIIALSNGNIYLVYNARNVKGDDDERRETSRSGREGSNEKYVIVYVSKYSPYVNMKVRWYKNYVSWMDKNGFHMHQLPNLESILFISNQFFSNPNRRTEEKEELNEKSTNYLSKIIDNGELYESTDESDMTPPKNSIESILSRSYEKVCGEEKGAGNKDGSSTHSAWNHASQYSPMTRTFKTPSIGSSSTWYTRLMGGAKGSSSSVSGNSTVRKRRSQSPTGSNAGGSEEPDVTPDLIGNSGIQSLRERGKRKYKLKRLKSKLVNSKYTRDNEHYGITSTFISDTVLVGYNNTLLCVKLINSTEEEFENYEQLLLNTKQNKDLKGYTKNNVTKNRRSNNVVRGYIEYKVVLPEEFSIIYIKYNTKTQYDVITWNRSIKVGIDDYLKEPLSKLTAQKREGSVCYKYNNDGRVYKYKMGGHGGYRPWTKEDLINVVFDLREGAIYCESIIAEGISETGADVIIGTTHSSEEGSNDNYISQLKYSIENTDTGTVIEQFKSGLNSLFNVTNISSVGKGEGVECITPISYMSGCNENNHEKGEFGREADEENSSDASDNGFDCYNDNNSDGDGCNCYNNNKADGDGCNCYNNNANHNGGKIMDRNKSAKYLLEYIGIFTEYLIKIQHYQGFKELIKMLNEYGIMSQYLELVFTGNVRKSIRMMGRYEELVSDIMETVGDDSVAYYKMLGWKMSGKMTKRLLNRVKEFLVKHVQQLYEGIELVNVENNQMMDSREGEIMNIRGAGVGSNRNTFSNETYFNLLMLLNELKRSDDSTGYSIYNLLYSLFTMTPGINAARATSYSNTGNCVASGSSHEAYKHQANTTSLSYYVKQNQYLQIELLSLKYYYKALNDQLRRINTRGTMYYAKRVADEQETSHHDRVNLAAKSGANTATNTSNNNSTSSRNIISITPINNTISINTSNTLTNNTISINTSNTPTNNTISINTSNTPTNNTSHPDTNTTPSSHPGYIEKNAVNCNICCVNRDVYAEVVNKLFDRVRGRELRQPKGNNILYFSCRHLVHEKCQIRLINQLQQDHGRAKNLKMNPLNTEMLLSTCLSCLTI
nr:hypothetical protein MACL_00002939 [Theileria orientalis]